MKRVLCLLLCLLAAFSLTGCSVLNNDWETEAMQDLNMFYRDENPETAPALPEVFALPYYPLETLDPLTCPQGVQQTVAALVYEGLYELDNTLTPRPVLAESAVWNGLQCVITLKSGVRFSDGSPLSAEDVADTLQRAAASTRYGARFAAVRSVTAGDGQVVITLTEENASLLGLLDIPVIKSASLGSLVPVGTGPYRVEGGALTVNPHYHGDTPPLEQIALYSCKDEDAVSYAFSIREVQLIRSDLTGSGEKFALSSGDAVDTVTSTMQYVGFHLGHEALARPEVRRAISLAIQRESIVATCLLGHGAAARFPFPPTSFRYPADLDARQARESVDDAMEAAGLNTGTKLYHLRLLVNSENEFRVAAAQAIAETLGQYDFEVSVQVLPWEEYLYALENGAWDLYYGEVTLTPDGDLAPLMGSGGGLNYGSYADPETDKVLSDYRKSGSRADLDALCSHLDTRMPLAPVCFTATTVMTAPGVTEQITPTATNPFYGIENWLFHLADPTTEEQ